MFFRKELKIISIVFVALLVSFAMADVSHNADFPVSGLNIQAILEPADSNYYHHIDVTGCWSRTELVGYPEMPYKLINLLIPADEAVSGITIDDSISQEIEGGYDVYPAQDTRMIDEFKPPFVPPDSIAYSSTTPYPGKLAEIVHNGYLSGYHLVSVRLYPVQYIPAEKKLIFYSKVAFTVHTRAEVSKAVPVYRRSPILKARIEKLVKSLVANPEALTGQGVKEVIPRLRSGQEVKPLEITFLPSIEGDFVDYVIITNEALKDTFQIFADWKTKKGVITQVRTIEWISANYTGCDQQEKIRNFIKDAYSYWGVGYVLLAGDTRIIPERKGFGWIPTDLYYSDLEGNWNFDGDYTFGEVSDSVDLFPELAVGRAPVETIEEADVFINKVLNYELNPPVDYLTSMLFMGTGTYNNAKDAEDAQLPYPQGGTGFPDTIFTKYELYAPVDDPSPQHFWSGDAYLSRDTVIGCMNQGFHLIWHVDHCSHYTLGTGTGGYNPSGQRCMDRRDAANLMNGDKTFILWTAGCYPNAFDYESISETFMNNPQGGAVGFIGCSIYGEWNDGRAVARHIFAALFHFKIYPLGDMFRSIQGMVDMARSYKYNLLGDPEMSVWSDTPESLIVAHPDTFWLPDSIFEVTVRGLSSADTAVVCVMKGTEAYASMMVNAIDSVATFIYKPHTTGYLSVTVTCHNYFVYEDSCYVAPCVNAYLYPHSHFIYDGIVWGNSDGNNDRLANPGETLNVYLSIANSGQDTAFHVTARLRSEDILISIIDSVVFYDTILDGEVVHKDTLTGGYFTFYLEPGYPDSVLDYHRIDFEIFIEGKVVIKFGEGRLDGGFTLTPALSLQGRGSNEGEFSGQGRGGNEEGSTPGEGNEIASATSLPRNDKMGELPRNDKGKWDEPKGSTPGSSSGREPQEWSYSLTLTEFCDSLAHSRQKITIINDTIYLYPEISNLGGGAARGVEAVLHGTPVENIIDSISYFGEIKSDTFKYNEADPFVFIGQVNNLQIVMHDYYGREWIESLLIDTILPPDSVWTTSREREIKLWWSYIDILYLKRLAGYNVYRSEDSLGTYERVNPILITNVSLYHDIGLLDWTEYFYKITAVDTSGNESEFSNVVSQRTQPAYQVGFPVSVPFGAQGLGFYYSSPAVADIDNDDKNEIAIGAQGRVYLVNHDGTVMPNWPIYLGDYPIHPSPALVDMDGDDTLEVIISTGSWYTSGDSIYAFNYRGVSMPGWPVWVGAPIFASPVIANIDEDAENEILIATRSPARLYAFKENGTIIPGFPLEIGTDKFISQSPVVADFDLDGKEEIFLQVRGTPNCELWLFEYDPDSTKIDTMPGWPQLLGEDSKVWPTHPAICDVDKNGTTNIIVASRNPASIRCYETDGNLTWEYPLPYSPEHIGGPGLGDVNQDGIIDIVYVITNRVYVISGYGDTLWIKELPLAGTWAKCSQGIVVCDINQDSYPEILFSSADWLWVLNHDGTVMKGAPFALEGDGHSTPAVVDLDNDGNIEVVCASGGDCKLKVWDLPDTSLICEWRMFQHDIKNTGRYYTPIRTSIVINDGADTTYSKQVNLKLHAESDFGSIVAMRIWDEVNNTGWIPYDIDTTWTLIPYDGIRRISAEFKDSADSTAMASDEIYKQCIDAAIAVNEDKEMANFKLGLFGFSINYSEDPVDSMFITQNGVSFDTTYLDTLVREFAAGLGKKQIMVQFKDTLGNISIGYKDSVLLDTLYPSGTLSLPAFTNSPAVYCTLRAEDDISGVDSFRLANAALNNIIPNGDFSDTMYWVCTNTTIQDGYAALHGGIVPGNPPGQISASVEQDLNPNLFQIGNTYRISAELITHNVMDVFIRLIGHLTTGADTVIYESFLPNGNHIYTGDIPFTDTFSFNISQPLEYIKVYTHIPEIISPPWLPPETLITTTVYLNNILITPILPDSIYSPWIPYYQDTTVLWQLTPGQGEKVVHVQYKDKAGNLFEDLDTTLFEMVPPICSVFIDHDVDTTNSSFVMLDIFAENGQSGVDKMQISNYPSFNPILNPGFDEDSAGWSQYAYNGTILFSNGMVILEASAGANSAYCYISQKVFVDYFAGKEDSLFTVSLRYKKYGPMYWDLGGISLYYHYTDGTESLIDSINLSHTDTFSLFQTTFPFQPDTTKNLEYLLIKISVRPSKEVRLTIDWIKLERSDIATPFTQWEPYDTIKAWQLIEGNGLRVVYAWVKDSASNVSEMSQDSIIVDTMLAHLAKMSINQGDKATNYHLVNLDFEYFAVVDSTVVWDDSTTTPFFEPDSYLKWSLADTTHEDTKYIFAKFFDFNRNISTTWPDSIAYDVSIFDWLFHVYINDDAPYTNTVDVTLDLYACDTNGIADMRITNEWELDISDILNPGFDYSGDWQTDVKYATIHNGYADIPSAHQLYDPNGEVAYIQQAISVERLLTWLANYSIDSCELTISMDVVTNGFIGDAKLKIAYHDTTGYGPLIPIYDFPQTDRVYWGRHRLGAGFMFKPDTVQPIDSLLIRIDIPVTYGVPPQNQGSIWIDNIEIQPTLPDTAATEWLSYDTTADWQLFNIDGIRMVYVQFRDSAGNMSWSVYDNILLDATPPLPPTGLVAQYDSINETVVLGWTPVTGEDVKLYRIYRADITGGYTVPLDSVFIPKHSYEDTTINLFKKYYYVVTAVDIHENESGFSNEDSVETILIADCAFSTAYNNGRKILANPVDNKVHFLYANEGWILPDAGICYCYSTDTGMTFTRSKFVGEAGVYPALGLDSQGKPCASWVSGSNIYYSYWGASWVPPESLPVENVSPPSMAVDNADTVHLVFTHYLWMPPGRGNLIYSKFHRENFNQAVSETLLTDSYCYMPSLVLDDSDYVHILWQGDNCICYQAQNTAGWFESDTIYTTWTDEKLYPVIDHFGDKITAVWQDKDTLGNLEIYSRRKNGGIWEDIKKVAETSGESKFPTLTSTHYCLWQDNTSGIWDIYMSEYIDTSGSWTTPENITNSLAVSAYPHSAYGLIDTATAHLYCLWTEGDTIPYTIGYERIDVSPVARIYTDLGQEIQSSYCLVRDGYWIFGEKPYESVDFGNDSISYKFTGLDAAKKYRLDVSYYCKPKPPKGPGISGYAKSIDVEMREINISNSPVSRKTVLPEDDQKGIGRLIQELVIDGISLDTSFIRPHRLVRISIWLPEEIYADGEIISVIKKVKGKVVVCGEISLYEFNGEEKESPGKITSGPQSSGEHAFMRPFIFDNVYPNPTKRVLKIRFNSPDERKVTVKMYDVVGRLAETIFDGKAKIGMNEFLIVPKDLSAGVYFIRLKTEGYTKTEKVILLR